jgi:hypothetical protein
MLSNVKTTLGFRFDTNETPQAAQAPAAGQKQIVQNGFDQSITLNAGSTPPAQGVAYMDLAGASGTLDLTNLQTLFGAQSFAGQKLRGVYLVNPNASGNCSLGQGASNGYALLGAELVCGPGASPNMPGVAMQFFSNALAAIGGTNKTLDWVNGTGGSVQVALVLG